MCTLQACIIRAAHAEAPRFFFLRVPCQRIREATAEREKERALLLLCCCLGKERALLLREGAGSAAALLLPRPPQEGGRGNSREEAGEATIFLCYIALFYCKLIIDLRSPSLKQQTQTSAAPLTEKKKKAPNTPLSDLRGIAFSSFFFHFFLTCLWQ